MHDEIVSIAKRELGEPPFEVTAVEEGLLHETYVLDCDGSEYVLQFASDADDDREDALRRGLNCYVVLRDSEVPVPAVVTEEVKEFDGRRYALVEKLSGETGERDVSPRRVRNAGRHLAKIHDATEFDSAGWIRFEDRSPSVREFRDGGLKQRILRSVADSTSVLRDGGLETAGKAVERVFDRTDEFLPDELPPDDFRPVLCHDDYSPDNVLFRGDEVTGIVDFDRAYAGHDHRDLVKAANCFWMHDPCSDWDVRAAFYDGYREVNELDRAFKRHEPLYRLETLAGIVAGLLDIDELSDYEREFYAARILDAVERVEEV